MYDRSEKTFERMREILLAQSAGKEPRAVVSKRTLFGIPSSVDEAIAKLAADEDERCRTIMKSKGRPASEAPLDEPFEPSS